MWLLAFQADKGRNDEVVCRVQSQCSSLGLSSVKVPNKVRNERLVWAFTLEQGPPVRACGTRVEKLLFLW